MSLEEFNSPTENLLRNELAARTKLTTTDLAGLLRLLAKWRHELVSAVLRTELLRTQHELVVQTGPFAGMYFSDHTTEGCYAPRLLGFYEHELHSDLEQLITRGFTTVLNIGCSGGYYAIGLARRMPSARVFAYDTDPYAQAFCRQLAQTNGVADRVSVGGLFRGDDFSRFATTDTLLVMDIEGDEVELLDPFAHPALRGMAILVECHDGMQPDASGEIARRFSGTHRVKRIEHRLAAPELPDCLRKLQQLDQLLAIWEWRATPTPWLVMEPELASGR
jgi:hypothetical protein